MVNYSENIIPRMTSYNSPTPFVISASSEYDTSNYAVWKIFNKNLTGLFNSWTASLGVTSGWVKIDLGSPKKIGKYSIYLGEEFEPSSTPKNWTFEGSNTGLFSGEQVILDTVTNSSPINNYEKKEFTFSNSFDFRYYRINITANNGDANFLAIGEMEIFESLTIDKYLISKNNKYYSYVEREEDIDNSASIYEIEIDDLSEYNISTYGMDSNFVLDLNSEISIKKIVNSNGISEEIIVPNFKLKDKFMNGFNVVNYTDDSQINHNIDLEVDEYSAYDYISEHPQIKIYDESQNDPFFETLIEEKKIYNILENNVEILYYTDNLEIDNVDLILEADYTPLDVLEGDLEVVTYSVEEKDLNLKITGIQSPKFITLNQVISLGNLKSITSIVNNYSELTNVRILLSPNTTTWYKWNGENFVVTDASNTDSIFINGNTIEEINNISYENLSTKWNFSTLNVGVLLSDDLDDIMVSKINDILITQALPIKTPILNNLALYILNTTASISLQFENNVLQGQVSDEDLTKVQYRVLLNDRPYFPMNGTFTNLENPPVNIDLTFSSNDLRINDFNKLVVEFKDYFGTVDYWEVEFIGKYSGLIFRTTNGEYYSSDIGEVLRYLDFGTIIAGRTSMEYTVVLKNEFGYNVKDVLLAINQSVLPQGLKVEFKKENDVFWSSNLNIADEMEVNQEERFNIRLVSELTTNPTPNGQFDIYVTATK